MWCATHWCSASSPPTSSAMASDGARPKVSVDNASREPGVPGEAELARWAAAALAGRRAGAELAIRIVDEAEGAELNATYRHKQGATNVLSFPAELPPGMPLPLLGDLVI